jgi:MarR family transcriptional regulator, lower aerobic nicotinate degradation pathway regulator
MTDEPLPSRLRTTPTWLVNQASQRAHRLLGARLAEHGARGYHYRLLGALQEAGPASQIALARSTGIDRSDVVAALNELEAKGAVPRTPDPADARRNQVTLTTRGAELLDTLQRAVDTAQDDLLADLAPAERTRLADLLARIA